mmetsp:Transcript_25936/g.52318  ORF Transcript_25936/g.52318 Transcript_25936/m.52318 type:complete len:475 (-) Transcript_25936:398-1822(-)
MSGETSSISCTALSLVLLLFAPSVSGHGWTSMMNELGEQIESRNSLAWKSGGGYPNPQGMSTTDSSTRPMYCGGLGQNGYSRPEHDLISAPDALKRARASGSTARLRKGSRFTLRNFITANHGGVAALYYSCPAATVDTPEEYRALDWKLLTPIKDSYPENKRNGVSFSDKMPEWYGFAGSICNFGAGYTGGVIQTCDDCQLQYGGGQTTADWKAEKPPSGAPLGTGQLATIVNVEYQLPADFECPNAVFSWIWHTPHLCIPKEVADTGSENDFWKFCNRNLQDFYSACRTDWQDEIFTNCMDAEVVGDGAGAEPTSSPPLAPRPAPTPVPAPAPSTSPPGCVPIGDCGASSWCDQSAYVSWCAGQSASCPAPFCTTATMSPEPEPEPEPLPVPGPDSGAACVATLESHYKDASIWVPYCANVGAAGACPSPMCKKSMSTLATSRKHRFLGASFVQASVDVGRSLVIPEGDEEL